MTQLDLDTVKYFDGKTNEIKSSFKWRMNILITSVVLVLLSAGGIFYANSRTLGKIEERTDQIYMQYVPGTLLWDFSRNIDKEFEALYTLENGDREAAIKIMETFAEEREKSYERHMDRTRGEVRSNKKKEE